MNQDNKVILGIGFLTIIVLAAVLIFGGKSGSTDKSNSTVDPASLLRDGSPRRGNADAPITIVEFGDFQCPSCAAEYPILKKILQDYEGKVQLVYRHFPLPGHPFARPAAEAAEAADDQGKFWEMHDKLFERQTEWSASQNPTDNFIAYAKDLGLDENAFRASIETNKYADFIQEDVRKGDEIGVDATPTIYINGEKMTDAGYPQLKDKIDSLLNQTPTPVASP